MVLLNSVTKEKILCLIKANKSLNHIVKETHVGKTTIYYYMKKIKGIKHVPICIDYSNLERIGEIVGFFAGDGQYCHFGQSYDWRIRFFFNEKEIVVINHYLSAIEKLTGKRSPIIAGPSIKILQVHSKKFCDFILEYVKFGSKKTRTIELKHKKLLNNRNFTRGFLRGLVDSDGYVRKGRREIYFGSVSPNLAKDFIRGLRLFGLNYKLYVQKRAGYLDFYKVRLSNNEVSKFVNLIKPLKAL